MASPNMESTPIKSHYFDEYFIQLLWRKYILKIFPISSVSRFTFSTHFAAFTSVLPSCPYFGSAFIVSNYKTLYSKNKLFRLILHIIINNMHYLKSKLLVVYCYYRSTISPYMIRAFICYVNQLLSSIIIRLQLEPN